MKFAEVALKVPLSRCFDYLIPTQIEDAIQPGCRVLVPFGKRQVYAVVLAVKTESDIDTSKLKPVTELVDSSPIVSEHLIALVKFASRYYHFPIGESFQVALPSLINQGKQPDKACIAMLQLLPEGDLSTVNGSKQKALLAHLAQQTHTPVTDLPALGFSRATLESLKKKQLVCEQLQYQTDWQHNFTNHENKPKLTTEQAICLSAINHCDGFRCFLLEGVTGSGKTEVYLQAIEHVLARGQQCLVLVPEIGLTPQTVSRFKKRFPEHPIMLWHSAMNDSERLQTWQNARMGSAAIVIGTRSAIFTPFNNLGMIIVDEEHDSSFKQQDSLRYHARDLAVFRASNLAIPLLLGTATPALETLNNALANKYQLLKLTERAQTKEANKYSLIDMRGMNAEAGIAQTSLQAIKRVLEKNKQVMIFLNRRGFAPSLLCHECGWLSQCPRCSTSATYHKGMNRLVCHHCSEQSPIPHQCHQCGSTQIVPVGKGTEQVEEYLTQQFPDVALTRIDRDSTRRKGSLEAQLNEITQTPNQARILIGTQMLAKGHHFPNVALVVILDVDSGLYSYDFRATEHLAQLIIQVAGRAGRSGEAGEVLLQTHFPEHPLLQDLINNGYQDYARSALQERKITALPPYSFLAILRAESHNINVVLGFLQELVPAEIPSSIQLLGPLPAPLERIAGKYRYQLHIQSDDRASLHRYCSALTDYLAQSKLATKVRWSLDIDPLTTN